MYLRWNGRRRMMSSASLISNYLVISVECRWPQIQAHSCCRIGHVYNLECTVRHGIRIILSHIHLSSVRVRFLVTIVGSQQRKIASLFWRLVSCTTGDLHKVVSKMALAPEKISIKRRRTEEPVDPMLAAGAVQIAALCCVLSFQILQAKTGVRVLMF